MSESLRVGQVVQVKRVFTQVDFDRFAALSGDDNPIHVDPAFAARTKFGRTVAHGMLLYSTVCGVLGSQLPGPGTRQVEQELMFPSPTYVGEEVVIRLEVDQVHPADRIVGLTTLVLRPDGNVGLKGRTLVQLPGSRMPSQPAMQRHGSPSSEGAASFKGFELGQRTEIRRTFLAEDLAAYVELAKDANPIFSDADYVRELGLDDPIIPGGLLGGLFSYLLGTKLPGRGTNYLKQRIEFPAPAYPGQDLTAVVEIVRLRPEKHLINLNTICTGPAGTIVCQGEALVQVSDVERKKCEI